MPAKSSTVNFGLTGIPLFIAVEMAIYGRGEQSHEEKMTHLSKAYGWLRAYLPVVYEKKPDGFTDKRIHTFDKDNNPVIMSISDVLVEAAEEIDNMHAQYQPSYEGQKTCSPDEKKFQTTMRAVFERLAIIVTFSGIADKLSNTDEVYF